MTLQTRLLVLLSVIVVVVAATAGYALVSLRQSPQQRASEVDPSTPVPTGPRIVFRNTTLDDANGLVMAVPLEDPGGPRAMLGPECDRVDANADQLVCLRTRRGVVTTFDQQLYVDGSVRESWPLPGLPSRTRLSPSGRLVANTVFVNGHSYLQTGFSTATVIRETSGRSLGNLESWDLYVDGERFTRRDRNLWGVTFVDDETFFATAASGDRTWLLRGEISTRTLTALRTNAECPSASPDGSKVAYKKLVGDGTWSVAVLDLESGEEVLLDATRGLDDQVAWRDGQTLLYGLPREDTPGVTDVWSTGLRPENRPKLLIENAWSPAVVA